MAYGWGRFQTVLELSNLACEELTEHRKDIRVFKKKKTALFLLELGWRRRHYNQFSIVFIIHYFWKSNKLREEGKKEMMENLLGHTKEFQHNSVDNKNLLEGLLVRGTL